MNVTLKSFAEEVPVSDLSAVQRFLVFENEQGEQLRIPVGADAITAVATFMGRKMASAPVAQAQAEEFPEYQEEDTLPEGAEEFGGEETPEEEEPVPAFQLPEVPDSEDEVPSL